MLQLSPELQQNIVIAHHRLNLAIRDHQLIWKRLESTNPGGQYERDLKDRLRVAESKISKAGTFQKGVCEQLREFCRSQKTEDATGDALQTVQQLLKLNNNNHIVSDDGEIDIIYYDYVDEDEDEEEDDDEDDRPLAKRRPSLMLNGHVACNGQTDGLQNGMAVSPLREDSPSNSKEQQSTSSASGEEEAMEVDGESRLLADDEEADEEVATKDKNSFLRCLGLLDKERIEELLRWRSRRRRRQNVRSQFLYDRPIPQKRKRNYLQSGNAPQTRQTTARLNGPSPPPKGSNNSNNQISTRSLNRASKSLIQTKTVVLPMRNGDSKPQPAAQPKTSFRSLIKKELWNGGQVKVENRLGPITSTGKTIHIPGLPPSLTVEWIDKDSTVCISCRNPGSLTVCESCTSKFHISCHKTSPASSSHCPKCVSRSLSPGDLETLRHEVKHVKKEYRDRVPTTDSTRISGKGGENSEIYKSLGSFCKIDTVQYQQQQNSLITFKQLPSSTLLIPISSASSEEQDDVELVIRNPSGSGSTTVSKSSYINGMAEIVRQLKQSGTTATTTSSDEWKRSRRQSLGQRRSSSSGIPLEPKQSVSILQRRLSDKSSNSSTSQRGQSVLKYGKSNNYVTVEVICNDDNDSKKLRIANENSSDCVYVSRASPGLPDIIDLESPKSSESKPEPEVLNISSGSSSTEPAKSPKRSSKLEPQEQQSSQSKLRRSSVKQQTSSSAPNESAKTLAEIQSKSDTYSEFLKTIFPGSYGYKIVIQICSSSSSSSSSTASESRPDSPSEQQRLEQMKLEEAHLSAPLEAELTTKVFGDEDEEEEDDAEEEGSIEQTTVPDNNKSEDDEKKPDQDSAINVSDITFADKSANRD